MGKKSKIVNMVPVAHFDNKWLYQGVVHINESELTDGHVQVPADCDLAPGGYYWDETEKTFVPTAEFLQQQFKKG